MDQDCIFCQIVRGDAPASIVDDDADVLAFMNRFQSVPGHVLIVPKAHVETLYALSDSLAGAVLSCPTTGSRLRCGRAWQMGQVEGNSLLWRVVAPVAR
jgi:histidine triad (HIT) family protein